MNRTRAPSAVRATVLAMLVTVAGLVAADDAPSRADALARRGLDDVLSGDAERERIGVRELVHAGRPGYEHAWSAFVRERETALPLRARLALIHAIACFDSAEAEERLATRFDDPHFEVRALVAQALGGGRSGTGVGTLVRLAADPTPSVRAAALRALFAIDRPDARAARVALPPDTASDLRARRLRLHRLRGDEGLDVRLLAARAYLKGQSADERTSGARLVVAQRGMRSHDLHRLMIVQYGGTSIASFVVRALLGAPFVDPDPAESRLAAAEALLAHVVGVAGSAHDAIPDAERDAALKLAVAWIAHPARVQNRQVDEEARNLLFGALPDLASDPAIRATLVSEVTRRLRASEFDDPNHGIRLLLAVGEATALPVLMSLMDPDHVPPAVLTQVSGAFRDLRRTGDAETARRLVHRERRSDIRTDGTRALAGEAWSLAGPFLASLLVDDNDAVASEAATVLLSRREPEARALVEAALLDQRWRPYEQNAVHALTGPADDAAYALLERMLALGSKEARGAVFIEVNAPTSSLRGPKAVALVRLAMDTPAYGIDIGTIATALSSVDGAAAVRYIREQWTRVTRPGVLLRNLQIVAERDALDFALEIGAAQKDGDDYMLSEVAAVVSGRAATDAARTDPFWRRLLSRGSADMRRVAVRALSYVDHGPMSAYLVPYLADANETASSRKDALLALERGKEPLPENVLWALAADRLEDEDLRSECARALIGCASDPIREKATDWLAQCVEESNVALFRVAELAGTAATPERARRLVELFGAAFAKRFSSPPFMRPLDDDDNARSMRMQALTIALATTKGPASLEALADAIVDPRFALFQLESRRAFTRAHVGGGGPLTSAIDPLELDVSLRFDGATIHETPRPPLPAEAGDIVEALVKVDASSGPRRVIERIMRARDDGSLARFDDLFLAWTALRIVTVAEHPERRTRSADVTGLPSPVRPDGPEATFDLDRRSQLEESAGRFEEAASLAEASLQAGARCGVVDLAPSRWLDRGRVPQPSWRLAKSRIEALRAAVLVSKGRADDARAAFAAATAHERLDPRIFQEAARLRWRAKFDLEAALADVERAAELERRQGVDPSVNTREMMAAVRRALSDAKGRPPGGGK